MLLVGVGSCCVLLADLPTLSLSFLIGFICLGVFATFVVFVGVDGFVGRVLGVLGVCVDFLSTMLLLEAFLIGVAAGVICWVGEVFRRLPFAANSCASSSESSPESASAKSSEESEDSGPISPSGTASMALVL